MPLALCKGRSLRLRTNPAINEGNTYRLSLWDEALGQEREEREDEWNGVNHVTISEHSKCHGRLLNDKW